MSRACCDEETKPGPHHPPGSLTRVISLDCTIDQGFGDLVHDAQGVPAQNLPQRLIRPGQGYDVFHRIAIEQVKGEANRAGPGHGQPGQGINHINCILLTQHGKLAALPVEDGTKGKAQLPHLGIDLHQAAAGSAPSGGELRR